MPHKIIVSLLFLSLFSFSLAKSSYRPPLHLDNIVSDDIRIFLENSNKNKKTKRISNHDLLGRRKNSPNDFMDFVVIPEETIEVDVAYLGNHKPSAKISGRYEFQKDQKKFWFNGKPVSEKEYFDFFSKSLNKNFRSTGFRRTMSASEIEELLNGPQKVFIQKAQKPTEENYADYSIIFTLSEISTYAHSNNYKGAGIGVYFDENGCPHSGNVNATYYSQVTPCANGVKWHPTGVVTTLQQTAPNAQIYGFGTRDDSIPNPYLYNPNIVIGSHSWSTDATGAYTPICARYDAFVYDERVTNFFAASNQSNLQQDFHVKSPAIAPNVIAVGAVSPTNFHFKPYSRHVNPNLGNQKPEIGNYAEFIFPVIVGFTDSDGNTWNGQFDKTSAATPYTAGIAADLFSQHSFFKWHPEVVKAHFLASEKTPIIDADDFDEDNMTIAKKIPVYTSIAWNHRIAYWNDDNDCCFDANNKITFVESDIGANIHYRIAIAWLTNPDYIATYNTLSQDLDLRVYQNNQLIAYSISSNDPFEVVDFTTTSNADLTIEILRYANSGDDDVILGYSFWNDL